MRPSLFICRPRLQESTASSAKRDFARLLRVGGKRRGHAKGEDQSEDARDRFTVMAVFSADGTRERRDNRR